MSISQSKVASSERYIGDGVMQAGRPAAQGDAEIAKARAGHEASFEYEWQWAYYTVRLHLWGKRYEKIGGLADKAVVLFPHSRF